MSASRSSSANPFEWRTCSAWSGTRGACRSSSRGLCGHQQCRRPQCQHLHRRSGDSHAVQVMMYHRQGGTPIVADQCPCSAAGTGRTEKIKIGDPSRLTPKHSGAVSPCRAFWRRAVAGSPRSAGIMPSLPELTLARQSSDSSCIADKHCQVAWSGCLEKRYLAASETE